MSSPSPSSSQPPPPPPPPRRLTPEEKELAVKRQRLAELEPLLVERELELETVRGGILAFEKKYQAATIERYAQLDDLRARIAELHALRAPDDTAARAAAAVSRAAAERTAAAARAAVPKPQPKRAVSARKPPPASPTAQPKPSPTTDFNPSERLKRLFRDVAKAIHPDLADNDEERSHRHAFMTRANEAYEQSSEQRLADILHEWQCAPESVKGQGPAAELIRAIRKIDRCETRLVQINIELEKLQTSGVFGIKMLADEADKLERDFLEEMTQRLDADIAAARMLLEKMEREAAALPGASSVPPRQLPHEEK
jgi:hypothetical protein